MGTVGRLPLDDAGAARHSLPRRRNASGARLTARSDEAGRVYVDVHTHVVPCGDDGAQSVAEGLALCEVAWATGTRVVYATPHMQGPGDQYPWSAERAKRYEAAFATMRPALAELGLELRRGREVYPSEVERHELEELRLEGTSAVLVELPGDWLEEPQAIRVTWEACVRIADGGLTPILAHPERCPAVTADVSVIRPFTDAGWLVCLNGQSVLGEHGDTACRAAFELLHAGEVALVASDAHRPARPARLDRVEEALAARVGARAARQLLDGTELPFETGGKERSRPDVPGAGRPRASV